MSGPSTPSHPGSPAQVRTFGGVACAPLLWRRGSGGLQLGVTLKLDVTLSNGAAAVAVPTTDLRVDELAPPLPAAEIIALATAFAPRSTQVHSMVVRMIVGRGSESLVDKTLHVHGDRINPHAYPAAFSTMPITYDRAVGGPGTDNPIGSPCPNILDTRDAWSPAGLGPLPASWPSRARLAPHGVAPYLRAGVLELPAEFPLEFFQTAPADQRVARLVGDEWLVFDGMHPTLERLRFQLPGFQPTARWLPPQGTPTVIGLALGRVVVNTDTWTAQLFWRGSTAVEPQSLTAGQLVAGLAPPEAPVVSRKAALGETVHARPLDASGDASPRIGLPFAASAGPRSDGAGSAQNPAPLTPTQPAREMFEDSGTVDISSGDSFARVALPFQGASSPRTSAASALPPATATSSDLEAPAPERGMAGPAMEAEAPALRGAVADEAIVTAAPVEETGTRKLVRDNARGGVAMYNMDLSNADLRGLDLTGAILSDARLIGARLDGAILRNARLRGAKLMKADLSGADLSRADLSRADLSRSTLTEARLDGADLSDATLAMAQGTRARFTSVSADRAQLPHARLDDADFTGASLRDADLSGCSLARASFVDATLVGARLTDATGAGVVFSGAKLDGAECSSVAFAGAQLERVDAERTSWEQADLSRARFDDARIRGASFAKANLEGASFARADLTRANLTAVSGDGADIREANLTSAELRMSKLPGARFDDACLVEVNAQRIVGPGATFTRANLERAVLRGSKLEGSDLTGARLDDCDLRDVDLENATLVDTDPLRAKTGGAILTGVRGWSGAPSPGQE